jgi:hypothetical protein
VRRGQRGRGSGLSLTVLTVFGVDVGDLLREEGLLGQEPRLLCRDEAGLLGEHGRLLHQAERALLREERLLLRRQKRERLAGLRLLHILLVRHGAGLRLELKEGPRAPRGRLVLVLVLRHVVGMHACADPRVDAQVACAVVPGCQ